MINPSELESSYKAFMKNLSHWIPDGVIDVDLDLLSNSELLDCDSLEEKGAKEPLPHYFHVLETNEKVTLFNHQFCVWIVPKVIDDVPKTFVMIALLSSKEPHLEIVFSTSGVYNSPKFILKILKYYLSEVIDNEEALSSINEGI